MTRPDFTKEADEIASWCQDNSHLTETWADFEAMVRSYLSRAYRDGYERAHYEHEKCEGCGAKRIERCNRYGQIACLREHLGEPRAAIEEAFPPPPKED